MISTKKLETLSKRLHSCSLGSVRFGLLSLSVKFYSVGKFFQELIEFFLYCGDKILFS